MQNKSMLIHLFLDPKQYGDIKEAATTRKIFGKNDSDLLRKILFDYTEKIADLVVTSVMIEGKMAGLKEQSVQKEAIIEGLRSEIHKLRQDNEILQGNLALKTKGAKHDQKI